jgi:hypothetical protein
MTVPLRGAGLLDRSEVTLRAAAEVLRGVVDPAQRVVVSSQMTL